MRQVRLLVRRSSLIVGATDSVFFVAWRAPLVDVADFEACIGPMLTVARASGPFALILAVHPKMAPLDDGAAGLLRSHVERLSPHVHCGATVLEGEWRTVAAAQAVAASLRSLPITPTGEGVFATATEAAGFVCEALAKCERPPPTVFEVSRAYFELSRAAWPGGSEAIER